MLDEEQRAAHEERLASYTATTATALANRAYAESQSAATDLQRRRFEAAREDSHRIADALAASAMNRALRAADLRAAFDAGASHHPTPEGN